MPVLFLIRRPTASKLLSPREEEEMGAAAAAARLGGIERQGMSPVLVKFNKVRGGFSPIRDS